MKTYVSRFIADYDCIIESIIEIIAKCTRNELCRRRIAVKSIGI
jgi:hypothetical protein